MRQPSGFDPHGCWSTFARTNSLAPHLYALFFVETRCS